MSRRKSIVILSVLAVLLAALVFFSFVPFKAGFYDYKTFFGAMDLGDDIGGGVHAVYKADLSDAEDADAEMLKVQNKFMELLKKYNFTGATAARLGDDCIRIESSDKNDAATFLSYVSGSENLKFTSSSYNNSEAFLTGKHIESVGVRYNSSSQEYVLYLKLNEEGTKIAATATAAIVSASGTMEITVGSTQIFSSSLSEAITSGETYISGMGSGTQGYQNALNYAMQLDACSFDVNLQILDSSENTAVAGTFAQTAAIIIAAVCFAVVLAAFPVKYKLMGLIADITVLFFAFVSLFLTAIIKTTVINSTFLIGMLFGLIFMVNALIVIIGNLNDNFKVGKTISASISIGYKKSLWAIVDTSIVLFVAALLFYFVTKGSLSNFALPVFIMVGLAAFAALLLSRLLAVCVFTLADENKHAKLLGMKKEAE